VERVAGRVYAQPGDSLELHHSVMGCFAGTIASSHAFFILSASAFPGSTFSGIDLFRNRRFPESKFSVPGIWMAVSIV